jgi:hypothetical protein
VPSPAACRLLRRPQVRQQLQRFAREMERDSAAQRGAAQRALQGAAQRAEAFVDRTLQLSNLPALLAYVLGPKGGSDATLPVSRAWEQEVVAGSLASLQAAGGCSAAQRAAGCRRTASAAGCSDTLPPWHICLPAAARRPWC